ncbi:MAG: hypothetical protein V1748_03690 [Actinomycetota bacterium]
MIQDGHNYGWPYFYGKNIRDDSVPGSAGLDPAAMTPSHIDLQAHSAPLGLDFFAPDEKAPGYANNLLIAYHGSWNRSVPTGYKVVRFRLDEQGNVVGSGDLVAGWLQPDGSVLGRPAGLSIRDGVVYVSDDRAGTVYRITVN